MATIKMTPESLREQSKNLLNKKTEHDQNYEAIKNLVNNVVSVWEGESQQAFLTSFQEKDATFKQFSTDIEAFAKLMETAAQRMQDTEAELKSQMRV